MTLCGSYHHHEYYHHYHHHHQLRHALILWPTISPFGDDGNSNFPCANGVVLSRRDRDLLDQLPASTAFQLVSTRAAGWSPLQYVSRVTAASSAMVMHMMLAYSAGEARRRRRAAEGSGDSPGHTGDASTGSNDGSNIAVVDPRGKAEEEVELSHYTAALRELRGYVGATGEGGDAVPWRVPGKKNNNHNNHDDDDVDDDDEDGNGEEVFDSMLATIFFMIQYGLQSMASLDLTRTHVAGLTSLVAAYVRFHRRGKRRRQKDLMVNTDGSAAVGYDADDDEDDENGISPLSSLLLLWMLYVGLCSVPKKLYSSPYMFFPPQILPILLFPFHAN